MVVLTTITSALFLRMSVRHVEKLVTNMVTVQLTQRKIQPSDPSTQQQPSVKQVNSVVEISASRKYISCYINDKEITLQHDNGAEFTVINHNTWKSLGSPELRPSKKKASSASNHNMPFVGEFEIKTREDRTRSSRNSHEISWMWM